MLSLATIGFAINFWAWALLSPLGPLFQDSLGLTAVQQALVVAVPVVVGSLGLIPVGALTFGGYVSFSVYLPAELKTAYGLTQFDAANRMAGFVLLAVLMRPVGGWLSDRLGPIRVLIGVFAVVTAAAAVLAINPTLMP